MCVGLPLLMETMQQRNLVKYLRYPPTASDICVRS
jgi:hypothetical protein